jgi:hypothetical protein
MSKQGGGAKSTAPLRVICQSGLDEHRFNIHPNDGFDLGMMTTRHSVETDSGCAGEVWLLNECPQECIQLNTKVWERLGKPKEAVLLFDGTILKVERSL